MPVKKGSVNGLSWIEFHEHPIANYRKQPVKIFDVTSAGYVDFPPDFLKEGLFDHYQYCICLMETALHLKEEQFSTFLEYQCAQLKTPSLWVIQFLALLKNNSNHYLIQPVKRKLNFLVYALENRRDQYSGYVREGTLIFKPAILQENDERFDIVKVKIELNAKTTFKAKKLFLLRRRTDYLQEIEDNKKALFVKAIDKELHFLQSTIDLYSDVDLKKIKFAGTPSQLANISWQLKEMKDEKGNLLFKGSTSSYARLICNSFCRSDGRPFIESSIRKFLTRYNQGEQINENSRIDISGIELKDD